jgi:hypothetical protein
VWILPRLVSFLTIRKSIVKQNVLKATLTLVVVMLTACSPAATATPLSDALSPTEPPTSEDQAASAAQAHPVDTLTNNSEIDVIIRAVAGGDPQKLRDLFEYTSAACMTVNALGGPPPCRADEAEGTTVEVLPSLGSEGSFLRKDEVEKFPGLHATGLYAVFRMPESAFSGENFPAGEYGIAYLTGENAPEVILHVTDGKIVRIDYVFGFPESNEILPEGVTDFVLEPVSR